MSKITSSRDFQQIVQSLPEFITADSLSYNSNKTQLFAYLKYYALPAYNNKNITLTIGKFKAFDFEVVVQAYQHINLSINNCNGIVVFVHGYFEHFGLYRDYINFLIDNNYLVIGYDLPGHGLSTGKAAHIVDFGQYAHSLEVLVDILKEKYKEFRVPFYLSAFSAGAAIGTEYLLRNRNNNFFNKVLWFAPLLRVPKWRYTELACWLLPIVKYVPRESVNISHDSNFITFIKYNDPLQAKMVPLQWVNALHHWVKRLPRHKPLDINLCIIQGTEDRTIDWRYNIPNLARIFSYTQVHYIPDGYHSLCNESMLYQQLTFQYVKDFFKAQL